MFESNGDSLYIVIKCLIVKKKKKKEKLNAKSMKKCHN